MRTLCSGHCDGLGYDFLCVEADYIAGDRLCRQLWETYQNLLKEPEIGEKIRTRYQAIVFSVIDRHDALVDRFFKPFDLKKCEMRDLGLEAKSIHDNMVAEAQKPIPVTPMPDVPVGQKIGATAEAATDFLGKAVKIAAWGTGIYFAWKFFGPMISKKKD